MNDEIRRAIKREIEPFVFSIKNELNITMDAFRKEIESYAEFKPDIEECKEIASENTRFIRATHEEMDKKIITSNQRILLLSKQLEDIKNVSNETSSRMDELEKVFLNFNDKLNEFNTVKSQIQNIDSHLGSVYKEIEESINNKLANKYNTLESQVDNYTKEFSLFKTQMAKIAINQSQTDESLNEKQKHINALFNELNDIKLKNNSTIVLLNNTKNKIENINANSQSLETKISNFNKQILGQNDNISTVQLGFKALAGEHMELKSQFDEINDQVAKEQSQMVMVQNEIESFSSSLKMQNEKMIKLSSQVKDSNNITESTLYSSLMEKINRCQMSIDEVSDVSNGKIASVNGKISELFMNIKDLSASKRQYALQSDQSSHLLRNNNNINLDQDEEFKSEQIKFNDLHEMTLNEISKQIIIIDKEIKMLKQETEAYEDNFIKIQDNFTKINPQLDKIPLFPELIKTLSTNHSTLQEEVQKGFNSITSGQNNLVANIDKTVSELRNDFENKLQMMKVSNTMNRVNVDSQRNDIDNKETIAQTVSLENKYRIDKLNTRCDGIDQRIKEIETNKLPQVYNYIDNTLKNLLDPKSISENRDNNYFDQLLYDPKPKQDIAYSMRENKVTGINFDIPNNQIQENIEVENKNEKTKKEMEKKEMIPKESNRVQEAINVYPSGYLTNNLNGTILNGDGLEASSKQTETIECNMKAKTSFYSNNNFIDLYYSKYGSNDKNEKNEQYLSMQPVDLIQNTNLFPKTYLKNFMIPRVNLENILEIEFDGNLDSEKEEEGNNSDLHQKSNNDYQSQNQNQMNEQTNSKKVFDTNDDFDDSFDN